MIIHHEPVLLNEVLSFVTSHEHSRIFDGTLGLGGYSEAILKNFPESFVFGIDRDNQAINFSRERLKDYGNRFYAHHENFGNIDKIENINSFDVYMFDLGVSNMQITIPERGFSFQNDGYLDMRMNPDENSMTAAEVLRVTDEKTLAKIFWEYGEERYSRLIASAIKKSKSPITTTAELVNLIRDTLPAPVQRKMGTHPARRIFQALRIYVNNETEELEKLLKALKICAKKNSLIIFVSYHSLEDRLVKKNFREWQNENLGKILTKHPLIPSDEEIKSNYKSRSGKLRAFCINSD